MSRPGYWNPGRRRGSQTGEILPVGRGPWAHLSSSALQARRQWKLSLQSRPLGLSLGTGDFEGWMRLHSEWLASLWKVQRKDFVIREGDRAGVASPSLMSEWPLSCPSLPGQGHGVDGAGVTPCHPYPSVF